MVTYTDFVDGSYKNPSPVRIHKGRIELQIGKVDFSFQALTQNDVHQALYIPKSTWILNAWLNILTACPASTKCDLGYGSDVNYWGLDLPLTAAGIVNQKFIDVEQGLIMVYGNRAPLANSPLFFASNDTMDVKAKGATSISSGVIEVCALMFRTD